MAKRDYYEVLGIGRDAGESQIKAAYRKLARKYHPDVNKAADSTTKFKEATEAYEVLSDPQKRKVYDQFGHVEPQPGVGRGARPGEYNYTYTPQGGAMPQDFEELFGRGGGGFAGMSLDDLMAALGGGRPGGRRGRRAEPQRGADLTSDITLEFLQAARGTSVTLQFEAGGPGGPAGETLTVKVPAGVSDGSRIRLRGKGQPGAAGAGDLLITVHVHEHPYFRREDNDIYVDVPVSITEAALGATVEVPTLDGITKVKIPPGTASSMRLRLRGKGIAPAGSGSPGDEYVVIKIVPPPSLSAPGQPLLRQFQEAEPFDPRAGAPWKN